MEKDPIASFGGYGRKFLAYCTTSLLIMITGAVSFGFDVKVELAKSVMDALLFVLVAFQGGNAFKGAVQAKYGIGTTPTSALPESDRQALEEPTDPGPFDKEVA